MSLKVNIASNLVGRGYVALSNFLFIPFYVSVLGTEQYGIIAFYAILLTVAALADAGLSATLSREAARTAERADLRKLVFTMERAILLAVALFAVMVLFGASFMATRWLNLGGDVSIRDATVSIQIMALMLLPQLGLSLYTAGLMGLERQAAANMFQIAFVTLRGGAVIPVIMWQPSLLWFFGWQLAVTLLFCLVARSYLLARLDGRASMIGPADWQSLRPVFAFARGMFAITLLAAVNTQLDKMVVSAFFAVGQFADYVLASTLAQIPSIVTGPLLLAMLPRMTHMIAQGDDPAAEALLARFCRIVAALSSIGCFGLVFFADDVLTTWLGAEHVNAAQIDVVRILALGGLFLALGATPFYFGLAHGHNATSVVIGSATLVVAVPLLFFGISYLGLPGAAWPWVLINFASYVALTLVVVPKYYRGSQRSLWLSTTALPVAAGAVAMAAAAALRELLDLGPLLACALAAVAGGICLLALIRSEVIGWLPLR